MNVRTKARKLAAALNAGTPVMEALAELRIDPEYLYSEDPGLALDDPANGMIDFGWNAEGTECVYLTQWGPDWRVRVLTEERLPAQHERRLST